MGWILVDFVLFIDVLNELAMEGGCCGQDLFSLLILTYKYKSAIVACPESKEREGDCSACCGLSNDTKMESGCGRASLKLPDDDGGVSDVYGMLKCGLCNFRHFGWWSVGLVSVEEVEGAGYAAIRWQRVVRR